MAQSFLSLCPRCRGTNNGWCRTCGGSGFAPEPTSKLSRQEKIELLLKSSLSFEEFKEGLVRMFGSFFAKENALDFWLNSIRATATI